MHTHHTPKPFKLPDATTYEGKEFLCHLHHLQSSAGSLITLLPEVFFVVACKQQCWQQPWLYFVDVLAAGVIADDSTVVGMDPAHASQLVSHEIGVVTSI